MCWMNDQLADSTDLYFFHVCDLVYLFIVDFLMSPVIRLSDSNSGNARDASLWQYGGRRASDKGVFLRHRSL